jgi:DNA-binding IclR family transcriptional regulator
LAGNSGEHGQSVASRLLRIIDAFDADAPELGLAEIGRRTGLPPATLHRLLGELVRHGAIERTGSGRYAVGLRLWEIGQLAPRAARVDEVCMPFLADLYEATHGTLHLAVRQDREALYVVAIPDHHPVRPLVRAGTRVPLTSPGVGEVLLAHAVPELVEQVLGTGSSRPANRLRRRLAEIRRSGVAVARDARSVVVAAPLYGAPNRVVAALSVAVRPSHANRVPSLLVRLTADSISRELRGRRADLPSSEPPGRSTPLVRQPLSGDPLQP